MRRIELEFRRAASRLLPDGCSVLAAVSGGGDSVALLHLLHAYAAGGKLRLSVAHLDHGLRRGSRSDRLFVERLAAGLKLPCRSARRDVARLRRKGESPEEAARRVRRGFLLEAARLTGADRIATGHTLDDQAETVLMRLVRGAGATALSGMAEAGPGPFVRPLLEMEREALRDYLRGRDLAFRDDPSNRDLRFDRNRARRLALPVLRESLNPRAARHLVKAARLIRDDALFLDELAAAEFAQLSRRGPGGTIELDAPGLSATPRPLGGRVAGLALRAAGIDARRLAARHIDSLLDLAAGGSGRRINLPGGLVARKARRWIRIRREV